jgi:putative PEP-CTERM system TPR-repeat lipoprotein
MNMRMIKTFAFVLVASLLVAACSGDNPEKQVASAKEYLQKNDLKAASIQVKNVLQKNPDLAEARFLLGAILRNEGSASAAEIEFRKALAAKHPESVVVPELASIMLVLGQSQKVVEQYGQTRLGTAAADASLQTTLSSAYTALGKPELAQSALNAAMKADPGFVPAILAGARLKAINRDIAGAVSILDGVIAKEPANLEAWKLKGDILQFVPERTDEALAAYRKSIVVDPKFVPGHLAVLTLLVQKGRLDEATRQLEQLKVLAPDSTQTRYLAANLAYQKKDYKGARELLQQQLRFSDKSALVLQLAGAVELELNSLSLAENYLVSALTAAPELRPARRLLISTYVRSGQTAKALQALNSSAGKDGLDPTLYSLAGEVYLQSGDAKKAADYFAKALKLDPTNAAKRTSLALTQVAAGQAAGGFGELQTIAESDVGTTADFALISAFLRRKDFDKALAAIDKLERKQPTKPTAAALRGQIRLAQKNPAAARQSFERALTIDPSYYIAVASLAALDLADRKPEEARKRYEALLAKDPKNPQALMALVELAVFRGAGKDEVAMLLGNAVAANPGDAGPRLRLIEFLLRNNDMKQATTAAHDAVAALPNSAECLDALGRVQLAAGETNQAIATFGKLVAMQPLSPRPHLHLAAAHVANKDTAAAEQSLRKALEIKPDDLEAQRSLLVVYLNTKKFAQALTVARQVQLHRPKEAAGYVFEGDIFAAQQEWAPSLAAYRSGLDKTGSTELAIKLHSVTAVAGKPDEAARLAADWLKAHPKDVQYLAYLGERAIARNDFAAAEQGYLALLQVAPANVPALNNLAWATHKLGKKGALAYAERANLLAPKQPALMDTLSTLLSANGDHARAIEVASAALALQPESNLLRLNLAKTYLAAGDKARARAELETLVKLGETSPVSSETQALLKAL